MSRRQGIRSGGPALEREEHCAPSFNFVDSKIYMDGELVAILMPNLSSNSVERFKAELLESEAVDERHTARLGTFFEEVSPPMDAVVEQLGKLTDCIKKLQKDYEE